MACYFSLSLSVLSTADSKVKITQVSNLVLPYATNSPLPWRLGQLLFVPKLTAMNFMSFGSNEKLVG